MISGACAHRVLAVQDRQVRTADAVVGHPHRRRPQVPPASRPAKYPRRRARYNRRGDLALHTRTTLLTHFRLLSPRARVRAGRCARSAENLRFTMSRSPVRHDLDHVLDRAALQAVVGLLGVPSKVRGQRRHCSKLVSGWSGGTGSVSCTSIAHRSARGEGPQPGPQYGWRYIDDLRGDVHRPRGRKPGCNSAISKDWRELRVLVTPTSGVGECTAVSAHLKGARLTKRDVDRRRQARRNPRESDIRSPPLPLDELGQRLNADLAEPTNRQGLESCPPRSVWYRKAGGSPMPRRCAASGTDRRTQSCSNRHIDHLLVRSRETGRRRSASVGQVAAEAVDIGTPLGQGAHDAPRPSLRP